MARSSSGMSQPFLRRVRSGFTTSRLFCRIIGEVRMRSKGVNTLQHSCVLNSSGSTHNVGLERGLELLGDHRLGEVAKVGVIRLGLCHIVVHLLLRHDGEQIADEGVVLHGLAVAVAIGLADGQYDAMEDIRHGLNVGGIHALRLQFLENGLVGIRIRELLGGPLESGCVVVPHGAAELQITIVVHLDQIEQGLLIDHSANVLEVGAQGGVVIGSIRIVIIGIVIFWWTPFL